MSTDTDTADENVHFLTKKEVVEKARRPGGVSAQDLQGEYPHCKAGDIYAFLESLALYDGSLRAASAGGISLSEPNRFRFEATT